MPENELPGCSVPMARDTPSKQYLVVTVEDGGGEYGGAWTSVYRASSLEDAKDRLKTIVDKEWCAVVENQNGGLVPLSSMAGVVFPNDGTSIKWSDTYFDADGMFAWYNSYDAMVIRKVSIIALPEVGTTESTT